MDDIFKHSTALQLLHYLAGYEQEFASDESLQFLIQFGFVGVLRKEGETPKFFPTRSGWDVIGEIRYMAEDMLLDEFRSKLRWPERQQ